MYNEDMKMQEGLLIFDYTEKLIYINECLLDKLNYKEEELFKESIGRIINNCNGITEDIFSEIMKYTGKSVSIGLYDNKMNIVKLEGCVEKIRAYCGADVFIIHFYMDKDLYRKNKEIELELELFLSTAVDLMAIIDDDLRFEKVNERWSKALGWSMKELERMSVTDIICTDDLNEAIERSKLLRHSGESKRYKNRYRCKDGSFRWLEWRSRYAKELGKYVCTATDITDTIEIYEKTRNFEKQLELEKIKSEVFSNVSHEFKTPLNIITATAQLIEKNINDNNIVVNENVELDKYINSIKKNAYRLIKMVNNVVDRSKIDAGFYRIHLENKDIVEVVEDITMSVVQYAENKEINLIFDTDIEELEMAIDSEKIERVMLNLLSNAIKHTNKDGHIIVVLNKVDGEVRVSVEDDGCGIPSDKLPGIFERFVQVDSDSYKRSEGSGIGLSLVKSLVEMHDGKVWAESEYGKGSKFIFTIPIKLVEKAQESGPSIHSANSKAEKCIVEFADILN